MCPGDELTYICVSAGHSQRWTIAIDNVSPIVKIFLIDDTILTSDIIFHQQHLLNFTLLSTNPQSFESSFSTVASNTLNNTRIECASATSTSTSRIMIVKGLYIITIIIKNNNYNDVKVFTSYMHAHRPSRATFKLIMCGKRIP